MSRARRVEIVRGFSGWYIRLMSSRVLQEQKYIGPYKHAAVASAMALRRGFTVVTR